MPKLTKKSLRETRIEAIELPLPPTRSPNEVFRNPPVFVVIGGKITATTLDDLKAITIEALEKIANYDHAESCNRIWEPVDRCGCSPHPKHIAKEALKRLAK